MSTPNGRAPFTDGEIERMRANATRDDEPWQLSKADFVNLCDMALASLSMPSPCGHPSQYAYTEDGGAHMVCLLCERGTRSAEVSINAYDAFTAWLRKELPGARDSYTFNEMQASFGEGIRYRSSTQSAIKGHDEARLLWLETLLKHCPHADLKYNDDPEPGEYKGWTLTVESCSTLSLEAPTLEELIDLGMAAEADEDGNVEARSPDRNVDHG